MSLQTHDLIREVRAALPAGLPFVIYGGALRDRYLGYPINDIDVAISTDPDPDWGFVPAHDTSLPGYEGTHLDSVWTNGRINLAVFYRGVDAPYLSRYCDIGLCQIAVDKWGLICFTEHFQTDVANRTLTRIEPRPNLNHFHKLMARFAERGFTEGEHRA